MNRVRLYAGTLRCQNYMLVRDFRGICPMERLLRTTEDWLSASSDARWLG